MGSQGQQHLEDSRMPKVLEDKLRRIARKKWPGDKEKQDRFVYGTLRNTGWKPEREKKGGKGK